jgi:hypothetical protein
VDSDDQDVVIADRNAALTIASPTPDGHFAVRLAAPGLDATGVIELESWSGGPPRLLTYFDDLATRWRGWDGALEWRDDSATVWFSATHDRIGAIVLKTTLREDAGRGWRTSAEIVIEPGHLAVLATSIEHLVGALGSG